MPTTGADRSLADLIGRFDALLDRVETLLPPVPPAPEWDRFVAFRWRKRGGRGYLVEVAHPHDIGLEHLVGVEAQKKVIERNTRQFVMGLPANNVLLTGSRGTGKSSLVKAMLGRYAKKGLRLIEVPIEFIERERGDSKMSGQVARESLQLITRWGLAERRAQLRRRRGRP